MAPGSEDKRPCAPARGGQVEDSARSSLLTAVRPPCLFDVTNLITSHYASAFAPALPLCSPLIGSKRYRGRIDPLIVSFFSCPG